MKTLTKLAIIALSPLSLIARADDQDHNGGEATHISCRVFDSAGKPLDVFEFEETGSNELMTVKAKGEAFAYQVELASGIAKLTLTDTRSGDKVMLEEGDLDLNETVKLTLITDEDPAASLSLECKGK